MTATPPQLAHYRSHPLRSHPTSFRSGHLTGLMRKFARLANFPNFFRYAPETSHKPDVSFNCV